jgi:hypothetical protein
MIEANAFGGISNDNSNWSTRGSPAEVMEPKPAAPATVAGAPSGGVLVTLKASARNSIVAIFAEVGALDQRDVGFRYCGPG